jgi:hypothetical protein
VYQTPAAVFFTLFSFRDMMETHECGRPVSVVFLWFARLIEHHQPCSGDCSGLQACNSQDKGLLALTVNLLDAFVRKAWISKTGHGVVFHGIVWNQVLVR